MCVFRPVLQRFGSDLAHVLHVKAGGCGSSANQCTAHVWEWRHVLVNMKACMWGWCFLWDASNELGLALPPMTILSPTIRSWCYPTTSTSVFLPFFPRHQHHYHSPAYYSSLLNTCPYHFNLYFPTLFGYFVDFRCPSNSFIPNSVHLGDSTHPS